MSAKTKDQQPLSRRVGRRSALRGTAGLAAASLGLVAAPAVVRAAGPLNWTLVTSWPKGAPGPGTTAERIARNLTELSDGRLRVTLYAAGELVPALEVFDAVSRDVAQMAHTASLFWSGKVKAAPFFTAVPFGLTPDGHNAWIYEGGGQALWDELYAPAGIKPFLAGNSGVQMGGWYKRELKGLDDLKGLTIRMPGLGGEILRRLGATAVALPPGEIVPALQAGSIDAAEFLGPWSDRALGFAQAAPYYYWPGFHEPNGSAECLVSSKALAALPADLQALVASVCAAENQRGLAEADWQNALALEQLTAEGKVQFRQYPAAILAAARETAEAVLDDLAAGDEMTARILVSYRRALHLMRAWGRVARHAVLTSQLGE